MSTVTKKDLVLNVSEKTHTNAVVVQDVVQALFDEMNAQLGQGNRIELRDFGVFSFKKRAARTGHNPRTLEKVQVSEKVVVSFKMGKKMKEIVNKILEAQSESQQAQASPAPESLPSSSAELGGSSDESGSTVPEASNQGGAGESSSSSDEGTS